MMTPKDILKLWPTVSALAADIGENAVTVRQWGNRKSIPSNRWAAITAAAQKRGIKGVTPTLLASIHAQPRPAE